MPKPFRTTLLGATVQSTPWMPDYGANPFLINIGVDVNSTAVYTVQHTFDPLFTNTQIPGVTVVSAANATWYNHPTLVTLSSDATGTYTSPVLAIRIITTAASATTTSVQMTLVQSGP